MYLQVYQYCLSQKNTKFKKRGSEWFLREEDQTVCTACRFCTDQRLPSIKNVRTEMGYNIKYHFVP